MRQLDEPPYSIQWNCMFGREHRNSVQHRIRYRAIYPYESDLKLANSLFNQLPGANLSIQLSKLIFRSKA